MSNEIRFNYDKLKGKIKEKCDTHSNFAKQMGWSTTTMTAKINNSSDFSQSEIFKAVDILGLNTADISTYFFTPKV